MSEKKRCSHCHHDLSNRKHIVSKDNHHFCCVGCKRIFYLLQPKEEPSKRKTEKEVSLD